MILVLVEHREGKVRDVTFEMLGRAAEIGDEEDLEVKAALLAAEPDEYVEELEPWADEVLVAGDDAFGHFNSDVYQQVLAGLVRAHEPELVMLGHTAQGMDLAPALAAELEAPLLTDLVDLSWDGEWLGEREIYGGRFNSEVRDDGGGTCMVTAQPAAFSADEAPGLGGSVREVEPEVDPDPVLKRFVELVEPEEGDVDIAASEVLVAVGRGIEDGENLEIVEELAEVLGAELAGSRPVIDNGWLPEDRQVGTSGKTVTPGLYVAVGISGASQHVIGMKGSETVVAINNDPDAPIFEAADFGIVDDLFDVVPALVDEVRSAS